MVEEDISNLLVKEIFWNHIITEQKKVVERQDISCVFIEVILFRGLKMVVITSVKIMVVPPIDNIYLSIMSSNIV